MPFSGRNKTCVLFPKGEFSVLPAPTRNGTLNAAYIIKGLKARTDPYQTHTATLKVIMRLKANIHLL